MGEYLTCSQALTQPVPESEVTAAEAETHERLGCGSFNMPNYWGRLYPARPNIKFHELKTAVITVGKLKSCDVCIKMNEVPNNTWAVISRQHFCITKIIVENFGTKTTEVLLKDLSMNGTFINGRLVGKGKVKPLLDNSVISVGKPLNEIYYYKKTATADNYPVALQRKYDMSICLGTGAFGEVTLVFSKTSGIGYAMKSIIKDKKRGNPMKLNTELEKLENEVKILQRIKHPNVIQLVDTIYSAPHKYLFLELMRGKDLFNRITTSKRLTEQQSKLYFYQIASGVQYLHQNEIIHRDLKPENVLLASDDIETIVKITDFGLSKMLHPDTFLRSLCGTKLYVAPEVLESGGSRVYTGQVDVWSMGVILYVCLSGQTPFSANRNGLTMDEQIRRGNYTMLPSSWECVSSPARKIVRQMMNTDPERRISIADIFLHPWLQDPPMKAKVEELIARATRDIPPCGKENVPNPSSQGTDIHSADYPPSPIPAALQLMSPPTSPPRKRRRC